MARACTAYKALEGKPFAYTHCLVLLADHPKWHAHESAKAQKVQDGVADLAEAPYKAPQRLPLLLLDGVEVALQAGARECALKISHKLVAKIIPGTDRP